jgi:hypothetical protein
LLEIDKRLETPIDSIRRDAERQLAIKKRPFLKMLCGPGFVLDSLWLSTGYGLPPSLRLKR